MTRWTIVLAGLLLGLPAAPAAELLPLRVLYVGTAEGTRAGHFDTFLTHHFREVRVMNRETFKPAEARDADVVLFDWSESEGRLEKTAVPLGKLEEWSKPTVLLNHAGLLVAVHWELMGAG